MRHTRAPRKRRQNDGTVDLCGPHRNGFCRRLDQSGAFYHDRQRTAFLHAGRCRTASGHPPSRDSGSGETPRRQAHSARRHRFARLTRIRRSGSRREKSGSGSCRGHARRLEDPFGITVARAPPFRNPCRRTARRSFDGDAYCRSRRACQSTGQSGQ